LEEMMRLWWPQDQNLAGAQWNQSAPYPPTQHLEVPWVCEKWQSLFFGFFFKACFMCKGLPLSGNAKGVTFMNDPVVQSGCPSPSKVSQVHSPYHRWYSDTFPGAATEYWLRALETHCLDLTPRSITYYLCDLNQLATSLSIQQAKDSSIFQASYKN
jgi:hypothetical protein